MNPNLPVGGSQADQAGLGSGRFRLALNASVIAQDAGFDAAIFELDARVGVGGGASLGVTAPLIYAPAAPHEPLGTGALAAMSVQLAKGYTHL